MKLSVIILNYNVRYFLELCLQSVQEALKSVNSEIIVVDNNSNDDSCEMIKQLYPNIILIKNDNNKGFSKGNNIGVAKAKGEYICILNPDTVVAEDTFTKLLEFAKTKSKLGAVGCKLVNGAGEFLPESKRNVPLVNVALRKLLGDSRRYYANHLREEENGKLEVLVGAFMFLKRETYNKVGGFDEDYFMYGEDIDLSYRLLKEGFQNYYFGQTTVIHFKGESTLRDKNYAKRFYGAMQIFYKKHFKKNVLFDTVVWLGIHLAYFTRSINKSNMYELDQYVLVSSSEDSRLTKKLDKLVIVKETIEEIQPTTEIIFNASFLSFKKIIELIQRDKLQKKFTFKILPKASRFIIGSNNTISRGEVIKF